MILYHKCKGSTSEDLLKGLSIYPDLYKLFKDAAKNSLEISTENPIIHNSIIASESSKAFLERINLALRILDVESWSSINRRSLMKRLTSSISTLSFPVISELEVYLRLVAAVGIQNVNYQYVVNEKRPDYKIDTNNKNIILELISIQERRPIEHIKNIFKAIANKILTDIQRNNFYLRIEIDSANLQSDINGKGRRIINEEKSIEMLENYLERIDLEKLIGLNCVLDFEAKKIGSNFVKVFGEDATQSQKIVNQWLQSHDSQTIAPTSIRRI